MFQGILTRGNTLAQTLRPSSVRLANDADCVVKERTLFQALRTAKAVAHKAGKYLRYNQGTVQVIGRKALRDELLNADLKAEEIILKALHKNFPECDILSEETPTEKRNSSLRWIVDPLDGSFNFQHGNPTFAISIGLLVNNDMQVGVIHLPSLKETFTAIRGRGAYRNGKRIQVSCQLDLNKAIVHVGDFAKDGNSTENEARLLDIQRLANTVGRVRMIGTAATDLAYVACGRAEAFIIHNALPWDIQIGSLLVKEAGGEVTFRKGRTGSDLTICSNKTIHQELSGTILADEHGILESDSGYPLVAYPG